MIRVQLKAIYRAAFKKHSILDFKQKSLMSKTRGKLFITQFIIKYSDEKSQIYIDWAVDINNNDVTWEYLVDLWENRLIINRPAIEKLSIIS